MMLIGYIALFALTMVFIMLDVIRKLFHGRYLETIGGMGLGAILCFCSWILTDGCLSIPSTTYVIWDTPTRASDAAALDDRRDLIKKIGLAGNKRIALASIAHEGVLGSAKELQWQRWGETDVLCETEFSSLDEAIISAVDAFAKQTMLQRMTHWLGLNHRRIVIAFSERDRWTAWPPIDIDRLLPEVRSNGIEVDMVEMKPRPTKLNLRVHSEMDLPAYKEPTATRSALTLNISGVPLMRHVGELAEVKVNASMDGAQAVLKNFTVPMLKVLEDGSVDVRVPLNKFHPTTPGYMMRPDFVRVEVSVEISV
ncbi:MAG TPA: hypothetical protein DDZ51_06115, partial [Planctomycetaceae bacterium]|nr:hypothetical protein [Planctomycetaceae bacterium]